MVSLGTVEIGIKLDVRELDSGVKNLERRLNKVQLVPVVNTKQLHDLNKLLDVKQKHWLETVKLFNSTPIKVNVDGSGLAKAQADIDSLAGKLSAMSATVKAEITHKFEGQRQGTSQTIGAIKELQGGLKDITKAVNSTKSGGIGGAIKGLAGAAISAPVTIAKGALMGFGQDVVKNFSAGFGDEINKVITPYVGSLNTLGKRSAKDLERKTKNVITKTNAVYETILDGFSGFEAELELADKENVTKEQKQELKEEIKKKRDVRPGIKDRFVGFANTQSRVEDVLIQSTRDEEESEKRRQSIRKGKRSYSIKLGDQAAVARSEYLLKQQEYLSKRSELKPVAVSVASKIKSIGDDNNRLYSQIAKLESEGDVWEEIPALRSQIDENALSATPLIRTRESIISALNSLAADVEVYEKKAKELANKAAAYKKSFFNDVVMDDNIRIVMQELGVEVPGKLPSVIARKNAKADATYNTMKNQIAVSPELYQRMQSPDFGTTRRDAYGYRVLTHEVTHADDFNYGDNRGIASRAKGRSKGDNQGATIADAFTITGGDSVHGFLSNYRNQPSYGKIRSAEFYAEMQAKQLESQKFGAKKINPFGIANTKLASAESGVSSLVGAVSANPVLKGLEKQKEILVSAYQIIESKIKELNDLSQIDYLSVDDSFIDSVKNKLAETIKTVSQFESSIATVTKKAEDILRSSSGYTSEMQDVESMLDEAFNLDDITKLQQAKKRIAIALKSVNQDGNLNKDAKAILTSEFVALQKKAKVDTRTASITAKDVMRNPMDAMSAQVEKSALQLADKGVELVHAFVDPIIEAVDSVKYMAGQVASNPIGVLGAAGGGLVKAGNQGIRGIAPAISGAYGVARGVEDAALSVLPYGHLAKKGLQVGAVTMGLPMAAASIPALAPIAGMLGAAGHFGGAAAGGLAASQMAGVSSIPIIGGQVAGLLGGAATGLGTIVGEMTGAAIAVNAVSVGAKALMGTILEPQTKEQIKALNPAQDQIARATSRKTSKLIEKSQNLDLYLPTLPENQRKLVGEYLPKAAGIERANQGDFIPKSVDLPGLKALKPTEFKQLDPITKSSVQGDWEGQYKSAQKLLFEFVAKVRGSIDPMDRMKGDIATLSSAFRAQVKRLEKQGKDLGFDVSKHKMSPDAFKGQTMEIDAIEMPDITKLKRDAVESGKDIGKGITVGSKSTSGQVELAFVELAQAGQDSFDKEMGIQSPSKWAIERMNFIALGLIAGATANLPKVKNMGEMTAQEYAKAFKKVIMPDVPTAVFNTNQVPKKQFEQIADPWGVPKYDVNKLPAIPPLNKLRPETKNDEANRVIDAQIKKTNELTSAIERKQKARERVNKLPALPPIDSERQKHFGKFKTDPYVYLDNNQPTGNNEIDALISRIREKGIVVDNAISKMVKKAQSSVDSAFDGVASTSNAESKKLIEKVTKTLNSVSLALDNYNFDDGKFIEGSQKSLEQLIDIYSIGDSSSNVSLEDIQAIVKRLTQTLSKQPSTGNHLTDMETQLNDLAEAYSIDPDVIAPDSKEVGSMLEELKQKEAELNRAMDLVDQREELVASGYSKRDANLIIANAEDNNGGSPPVPPIFDLIKERIPIIGQAIDRFDELKNTIKNFGMMAVSGIGLALLAKGLFDVGKNALTAYKNLEGVFISAKLLGNSDQYIKKLRQQSLELGSDLGATLQQGIQFSAALVGTPLEAMGQQMFQDSSKALTMMGLSSQQYESALLALKQVASKGRVSLEEITGQLGEAVPGIMPIVADALGTNVQGAIQQIESGNVLAEDLLPKLVAGLKNRTAGLEPIYDRSLTAATGRVGASLESLNVGIGERLAPAVIPAINVLSEGIIGLSQNVDKLMAAFKYLSLGLAGQMIPAIGQAVQSLFAYNGVSTLATMSTRAFTAAINVLKLSVKPLLWAFAAISAFELINFTFKEKGSQSVVDAIKSIDGSLEKLSIKPDKDNTIKVDFVSSGSGFLDFIDAVVRKLNSIPRLSDLFGDAIPEWAKTLIGSGPVGLIPNFGGIAFDTETKRVDQLVGKINQLTGSSKQLSDPNVLGGYIASLDQIDEKIAVAQGQMAALRLVDAGANADQIKSIEESISGKANEDGVRVGGLIQQREAVQQGFDNVGQDERKRNLEELKTLLKKYKDQLRDLDTGALPEEAATLKRLIGELTRAMGPLETQINMVDEALKSLGNNISVQRRSFINLSGAIAQTQENYATMLAQQRSAITDNQVSRGLQSQVDQYEDLAWSVYEAEQSIKQLREVSGAQKAYINSNVIDTKSRQTLEDVAKKPLDQVRTEDVTKLKLYIQSDNDLKGLVNESMVGVLEEIASTNTRIAEAGKGLSEAKKAFAQFGITKEDYYRDTTRQIYDLGVQIATQKRQDMRSVLDFRDQLINTSIQLQKANRGLLEAYDNLSFDLNVQLATAQKSIEDTQDRIKLNQLKAASLSISPGNSQSIGRRINDILLQFVEGAFNNDASERQIKIDLLNLEKERIGRLTQIRDLEEQNLQLQRDHEKQVRSLNQQLQDLAEQFKASALQIGRATDDLERNIRRSDVTTAIGKQLLAAIQSMGGYAPPAIDLMGTTQTVSGVMSPGVNGAVPFGIGGNGRVQNQGYYSSRNDVFRADEMRLPPAPSYQGQSSNFNQGNYLSDRQNTSPVSGAGDYWNQVMINNANGIPLTDQGQKERVLNNAMGSLTEAVNTYSQQINKQSPQVQPAPQPPKPQVQTQAFKNQRVANNPLTPSIVSAANRHGVPPEIALGLASQETGDRDRNSKPIVGTFNHIRPDGKIERSPSKDKYGPYVGVMQVGWGAEKDTGFKPGDRYDVTKNIEISMKYLRMMFNRTGSWAKALAAYNAGLGNVPKGGGAGYSRSVLEMERQLKNNSLQSSLNFGVPESIELGNYAQASGGFLGNMIKDRVSNPEKATWEFWDGVFRVVDTVTGTQFDENQLEHWKRLYKEKHGQPALDKLIKDAEVNQPKTTKPNGFLKTLQEFNPFGENGMLNYFDPNKKQPNQGVPKLQSDQKNWNAAPSVPTNTQPPTVNNPAPIEFKPSAPNPVKLPTLTTDPGIQSEVNKALSAPTVTIQGDVNIAPFIPVTEQKFDAVKGQADNVTAIKQEEINVKQQEIGSSRDLGFAQLQDQLVSLQYSLSDAQLQRSRQINDQGLAVEKMTRNMKGYLTVADKVKEAGLAVSAEYRGQIRSLDDQLLQGRRNLANYDKEIAKSQEILNSAENLTAEKRLQTEQELAVINGLKKQEEIDMGIVASQRKKLEDQKEGARINAENLANLRETFAVIDGIAGKMAGLASARYNYGGSLINRGPVVQATAALQGIDQRARLEGIGLGLADGSQEMADYIAIAKETAQVNLKQSYVDAIPFMKEFSSWLKDVILQTDSWQAALKKLLDLVASTVLDQLVIKPIIGSISEFMAPILGLGGDLTAKDKETPVASDPGSFISGLAGAVGFTMPGLLPPPLSTDPMQNFTQSLQQATLALASFTASLGGGMLPGMSLLPKLAGFGGGAASAGMSLVNAIAGGFTGSLPIPKLFFNGGMVDDKIQNLALGGVAGDPLREIGQNAIVALNREKALGGGKPVLAALTAGEVVVPRSQGPKYLAFERAYQVNGLMAEAKQINNYALGGRVGDVGRASTVSYGGNTMTVVNNTNVSIKDANMMGYSLSQIERRNQIQADRAKRLS